MSILEGLSVERIFCLDYLQHLFGREHLEKTLVILLLELFQANVYLVLGAYNLCGIPAVSQLSALLHEGDLLLSHLTVEGKELRTFCLCQLGGTDYMPFQVDLKSLWVEMAPRLGFGNSPYK